MATWTEQEDKVLIDTVFYTCESGNSIANAFLLAAKKLENRTADACSTRWYDKFQDMYNEQITKTKSYVKRTNDYTGPWNIHEEGKFLDLMVNYLIQDMGVYNAIIECSKILGRSISSCKSRWYSYIEKRNRLTIENRVKEGKERMATDKKYYILRNWEENDEKTAFYIVKEFIKNGKTMEEAHNIIAQKLELKLSTVKNYWYQILYPENKEEIDELRKSKQPRQIDSWAVEKQYLLYKMVTEGRNNNEKMNDIMAIASGVLGKSLSECNNIWYNHIKSSEEFARRFKMEAKKTAKKLSKPTGLKFVSKEEPKVAVQEEPKVKQPLEMPNDLLNVNEFIETIQKLAQQNKALKAENAELKKEVVQAKEIQKNYEEVLVAVEKARKFIVEEVE